MQRTRSRRHSQIAAVIATLLIIPGLVFAIPASATSKDAGEITFSVIGPVTMNPDGTVDVGEFRELGVTDAEIEMIENGEAPEAQPEMQTLATYSEYSILTEWKDNVSLTIPMRYGSSTWGYRKIVDKHNANTNVARTTTKYPQSRVVESSSSIRYRTPVNEYVCPTSSPCYIRQSVMVRAIVNPTILSDKHRKGVITTYCEGMTLCPDWVKNAANAN